MSNVGSIITPAVATLLLTLTLAAACERTPPQRWERDDVESAVAPARAGRRLTPAAWPNGARVAVCLSFDVDNETLALSVGRSVPSDLSAGEFGATQGLPRVLALLDKHDVPASFFIPAVSAMLHPEMIGEIEKRKRHEIGVHGWVHENYQRINDRREEERLIQRSIDYLTEVLGRRPVGFRAPSWAFSRHTPALIRAAGFLYDSSLMAMDEPYEIMIDGQPTGIVELPVDWILDDYPYFTQSGALPSPRLIFEVYRDEFDLAYEEGSMMMLAMHPHVIGRRSRIAHLERFVRYMKSKPGVWFATAEEIARYVKASAASK